MKKPTRRLELSIDGLVCGVDEVGYSPIAGPVVAAAVILPDGSRPRRLQGLMDSKQLSAQERERFDQSIRDVADVGIGSAGVVEIDTLNIYQANRLAMSRAIRALRSRPDVALVDGRVKPEVGCRVRSILRGDEKCLSIAAASVVAKVFRDDMMHVLAKAHPGYGWETNVGYGTEEHCLGLLRFGPTPHHRKSFAPLREWLANGGVPDYVFTTVEDLPSLDDLEILEVRVDLRVIFDRARRHLATLKKGAAWRMRSVGYDDGLAVYGEGPLAEWHGATLTEPNVECLRELIGSRQPG